MSDYLNNCIFDFSRKYLRVSDDGGKTFHSWYKFEMAYAISHLDYYKGLYADTVYSLFELKSLFRDLLQQKVAAGKLNVKIIY